jgi:hypothetical protein
MLRTALGPAITAWLEDTNIVEVMLNPDGSLWVDRLSEGLPTPANNFRRPTASGLFAWSRITSGSKCMPGPHASQPSCRKPASGSRD